MITFLVIDVISWFVWVIVLTQPAVAPVSTRPKKYGAPEVKSSMTNTASIAVETPHCEWCGKTSTVMVNADRYEAWCGGKLVQLAFPDMPADQRELLISGTHPECWKQMCAEGTDP
jgi:hypothetical protein